MMIKQVFKLFSLSLEFSTYINEMSKLLETEQDIIKNKEIAIAKVCELKNIKESLNKLEGSDMGFDVDCIASMQDNVKKFIEVNTKMVKAYEKDDMETLTQLANLFSDINREATAIIKELTQ